MKHPIVSIRSETYGELIFNNCIPEAFTGFLSPNTHSILASCQSGNVLIQKIETDDFILSYYTILLSETDTFHLIAEQGILSLNLSLQNTFSFTRINTNELHFFHEGQYNMSFLPRFELKATFYKEKLYRFITMSFSYNCLLKLKTVYPQLSEFICRVEQEIETHLFSETPFMTKEMKKIAYRLLHANCKDSDTLHRIKNGCALEILVLTLEHVSRKDSQPPVVISVEDAEKIYAARDALNQQIDRSISLFELARTVGMNVHKLSTGFHQITGMTVFHYHRKIRMARATQLLLETNRDLFDIGTEVGYIDGKTFSKEFKKANGVPPLEYRRQARLQPC